MSATPAAQRAPQNDDAFVILVKKLSGAMAFTCPQAELDVQLSRADVTSLEYFQDPALRMGGRMKVTLAGGSALCARLVNSFVAGRKRPRVHASNA